MALNNNVDMASDILNGLNKVNYSLTDTIERVENMLLEDPDNRNLKIILETLLENQVLLNQKMVLVAENIPSKDQNGNVYVARQTQMMVEEKNNERLNSLALDKQSELDLDGRII